MASPPAHGANAHTMKGVGPPGIVPDVKPIEKRPFLERHWKSGSLKLVDGAGLEVDVVHGQSPSVLLIKDLYADVGALVVDLDLAPIS